MAPVSDGFAARLVVILLVALALVQGVIAAAMLTGPGRDSAAYSLPLPNQIVAIIEAVEASPAVQRGRIVVALNSSTLTVQHLADMPEREDNARGMPVLEYLLKDYSSVLAERDMRMDAQRFGGPSLLVSLGDGSVLQFMPNRAAVLATMSARVAVLAALFGLVIVTAFVFAIRRTSRPVRQLALASQRFARDLDTPDLPEDGPREIRELSIAFNQMKRTIRGLVTERTRMLAAIAHDLRTYLTRLRLRVDFIEDAEQSSHAARDLDEMSSLLDETLYFARETSGSESAETGRVATAGVAAVLRELCAARQQAGADVQLELPLPEGQVDVSVVTLRRAIDNLIENALRYGRRARLRAARDGRGISITVDDDGPGIPADLIERCLRPFERLEHSRHRATGGTGLGLAIVHALVQNAGGDLKLSNRAEGGLRCVVALPLAVP